MYERLTRSSPCRALCADCRREATVGTPSASGPWAGCATRLRLSRVSLLLLLGLVLTACVQPEISSAPTGGEWVSVSHVVDGDSVELASGDQVRYLGINAPERGQPFYDEAREANRRLVEDREVWLVLDVVHTDRYGRILGYLWVDDRLVNQVLVQQGHASAYAQPPNEHHSQEILRAERDARNAHVGIWTPSAAPVKISDVHFDAPGPDHENPNGEWVELSATGSARVNLKGFTLKDEANHIFVFPAVVLVPGESLRIHSGQGQASNEALFWGLEDDAVWSNDGDRAFLRDAQGLLVDIYE